MHKAVLAILICASASASAKCPFETFTVSGHLSDSIGNPIPHAVATVSWRGGTQTTGGSESVASGEDGSFALRFLFNTFSRETLTGDVCEARLLSAVLEVAAPGYRSMRNTIQFTSRAAKAVYVLER